VPVVVVGVCHLLLGPDGLSGFVTPHADPASHQYAVGVPVNEAEKGLPDCVQARVGAVGEPTPIVAYEKAREN
jgi:hypothetical protein